MGARERLKENGRGRQARRVRDIPWRGWVDILRRVFARLGKDRLTLVAGGITFYLVLALFPALAAFVSLYGLFADAGQVAEYLNMMQGVLPQAALDLIGGQLMELASQNNQALGIGFLISFAFSFWSANNGIKALFEGMNIAYNEREKRGFIRLTAISFACTIGAMIAAVLLSILIGGVPVVLAFAELGPVGDILVRAGRWVIFLAFAFFAVSVLYRVGPSREDARWQWVSAGSLLAVIVWVAASVGFSFYLQNFADYNATYGTLGAAIGFMMWIWISVMILLVGAELNAEMEHQTAKDTTTGEGKPMGQRGAYMADHLAADSKEEEG
ncbi:YihY/virulence factor BrkB family protein [Chelativorans sp. Marseille-P2723]|uniref:YihY/virulence factor BrkB family protein n=1 Tax=Chelativorans sp. Marseille-P2723 TaxID=2709133 RepID=UPI0015702B53|nr:YihY/virulence factor BrkB family protein [Chelativorans sp. Marseille-P2723]